MDNQTKELQELKAAFEVHEAVCEERWKTIFNELREGKEESKERGIEVKNSVNSLHRLVWGGGGAIILFLLGTLMKGEL